MSSYQFKRVQPDEKTLNKLGKQGYQFVALLPTGEVLMQRDSTVDDLETTVSKLTNERARLSKDVTNLKWDKEHLIERMDRLTAKRQTLENEVDDLLDEIDTLHAIQGVPKAYFPNMNDYWLNKRYGETQVRSVADYWTRCN